MRFLLSQFKLPTRFNPLSIFILLFIVIPVVPVHAEQWQKLDVRGYVNDFAGVLNPATVEKLTQLSTEIDQKAKAQVAVVTVKTLEDDAPEDFANHLFQKWGVGYKGTDRGVLVLVATDDHKYWTEVGYGLEPILPDGKVGRFGRNMVPLLRQGNYNDAILQMAGEIAQVIALDSHVSLDGLAGFHAATAERQPTQLTGGQIILVIIVFLIVAPFLFKFLGPWFLLSLLTGGGGRGNDGWGGGGFGGGGGGGGFGGFGGGSSGGGGAGGSW